MPIKPLIKSGSVKEDKHALTIDYSNLDPSLLEHARLTQIKADKVLFEAETKANNILKSADQEAQQMLKESEIHAKKIIDEAREQLKLEFEEQNRKIEDERINAKEEIEREKKLFEEEKQKELDSIKNSEGVFKKEIEDKIWESTKKEAADSTKEMYGRLISQVHSVLNEVIKRRNNMLDETQKEMAELVLLIARKVVKVISQKDNNVVIKNIIEAMAKLKGREKFLIRINSSQLEHVQKHLDIIKAKLEEHATVTILEDTTVDFGGCIVETEFGEIDARISTQLAEIERRVLDSGMVKNVSV